jgi:hypothetical protein
MTTCEHFSPLDGLKFHKKPLLTTFSHEHTINAVKAKSSQQWRGCDGILQGKNLITVGINRV